MASIPRAKRESSSRKQSTGRSSSDPLTVSDSLRFGCLGSSWPWENLVLSRMGRLDGRTCLIVGGTSGIGLASAQRFLQEGARVVVAGRAPEGGRTAMEPLTALGPAWEFTLDLGRGDSEVLRLFEFALEALGGRLDI